MALSKPKLLQTLPLLSFIALFLMLVNKVHTFDFEISDFKPNPSDLTYQGDAHVPSGSSFLRLTRTDTSGNPQSGSVGRVLYSTPVLFWELGKQVTFETTITFNITSVNNNPADGIAFFIAPVGSTIPSGSSGGNLGIFDSSGTSSPIFAVEFDVYSNEWDPRFPHIGIDVNNRTSIITKRFDNVLDQLVNARIEYNSNTRNISVFATSGSRTTTTWYVFNLKSILPPQVQVGISASTGQEVAVHDIHTWNFIATLVDDLPNNSEKEDTYIKQYV